MAASAQGPDANFRRPAPALASTLRWMGIVSVATTLTERPVLAVADLLYPPPLR